MRRRDCPFALATLGLLALLLAACGGSSAVASSRSDSLARPRMPSGFSGVALVWRDGSTIAAGGYPSSGRPVSATSTVFDIGSVAKSITAAAVLRLVADGKLRLSERLRSVLPAVPRRDGGITISQLLTHTSGLPTYFASERSSYSERGAVRAILRLRRSRPGRFRYSDAGYTLLAAVVQDVAKQPFRVFVRQRLLIPAGMSHTGWYGQPPPDGSTAAHGFVNGVDTGAAGHQASASWSTLGAGGMVATAADLARWALAIVHRRVLPPWITTAMLQPRVRLPGPGDAAAAFGWITAHTSTGTPLIAVGGGTDYGFTSDLRIYPTLHLVTVALAQSTGVPAVRAGTRLAAAYAH